MADSKNDIQWHELSLSVKGPNNKDISIDISTDPMFPFIYNGMNIEQSMFEGGLKGTLMLRDADPQNAYNNKIPTISPYLRTGGKLKMAFSTPGIDDSFTELQFYMTSISLVANQMPGMYLQMGESTNRLYQIEFSSYEDVQVYPENREFGDDEWVGPIDKYVTEQLAPNYFDGKPYSTQKNRQTTSKEPMEVDKTRNWVWLRPRYFLYPWGKVVKELNVDQLINNFSENAIDLQYNAPNYFFWQDFDKWYFKSITSLISERYINQEGYWRYSLTSDEGDLYRFESIKSVKAYDLDDLTNSGAFASKYRLVEPNYNSIYDGIGSSELKESLLINHLPVPEGVEDLTNFNNPAWTDDYRAQIKAGTQFHDTDPIGFRLRERDINFDYRCDFLGLPMGPCKQPEEVEDPTDEEEEEKFNEQYSLFKRNSVLIGTQPVADLEDETLFTPEINEIYDAIYGWFNFSQYNNPNPTLNDQYSYVEGKNQDILWQTMFDITPLDGNLLYTLRSIRSRLKKKRLAYSLLSTLKQHWNYYRYSMCCSQVADETEKDSFAVLVGIETPGTYVNSEIGEVPIGGGPVPYETGGEEGPADNSWTHDTLYWPIYRYAFYPVEIVPKWDPSLNYYNTTVIPEGSDEDDESDDSEESLAYGRDFLGRPCDAFHPDGKPKRVYERYDQTTLNIINGNAQPNNEDNLYTLNHDHLEWFNINPNKNANFYAIPLGIQFEVVRDEDTDEVISTKPYHSSFTLPDAASTYGTVGEEQEFGGNRCKIKENVVEGFFLRGKNVAWNINELSNYWTWVNPGINMYGEDYPNHPESFSMMPVGAVFGQDPTTSSPEAEINDPNKTISPPEETYRNEETLESEILGRIVRLTPVNKSEYEINLPFNDLPVDCSDVDDEAEEGTGESEGESSESSNQNFPASIKDESGVDADNGIFMIVNKIFGTDNIPKPFGGKKQDLEVVVREVDENDETIVTTRTVKYDQDCTFPISTSGFGADSSSGAVETPIYVFDVENSHDGNCDGNVPFGPYMSNFQLNEDEEEEEDESDEGVDEGVPEALAAISFDENQLDSGEEALEAPTREDIEEG